MKIRTRAFLALWLIAILLAGTIGFIAYALSVAGEMDAERQRLSEIHSVHGSLWRSLVELKHDQHDLAALDVPSIRERLRVERSAVDDYLAQEAVLVRAPDQVNRVQELRQLLQRWSATWDTAVPQSGSPEVLLARSEADFQPVAKLLADFDRRERELWEESFRLLAERRTIFFSILATMAVIGIAVMAWLMVSTKRVILDPLTQLTGSAQRIEHGDFSGAHQTLRADEIGVLMNSFAKMVQAVQVRERELAKALSESRELTSVTAESRRRVEAAHADLLATLETVPAALMIFNVDGGVRLRNRAATDVFGIEPHNPDLRKNYWGRFKRISKDGAPIPPDEWISARALRGETIRNEELEIHHPDGRVFPILASGAPLRNELGHVAGAVVAFQDIARLREVDRMKDEFVSIVSHELRTPLTSIRGSVQLVLDDVRSVPDDEHRGLLQIALNNCERLVRIINDILDVSKIESGNLILHKKPFNVVELVRQSIDVVASPARSAGVTLEWNVPANLRPVMVDPDRMVQALVNLLSNAVKFAPSGTKVTVSATGSEHMVTIAVADQGEGIAPENLNRLFQKFQQVDSSSSRRKGGTGLGLAITKALVEQHGGRIFVDSELHKGTRFSLTMATATAEEASSLAPVVVNDDGSARLVARRVLVVDDDDDFRILMKARLNQAGYEVLDARDAESALQIARTARPDVITADLLMPGVDGVGFIDRLRSEPSLAHIPVVVVSGATGAKTDSRLPLDVSVIAKGEGHDRLLREISLALAGRRGATILVAEDDADLRGVLVASLTRSGHRVIPARDGAEALAAIEREQVDLLVLDLVMPNIDGFEVLARMKEIRQAASIPVVVVTGTDRSTSELRALRLGANVYLTKPIEAAALTDEVTRLLTTKK
ncbi:MAG TPA: response regulator [Vicinamibacterales bacterium]